MKRTIAALLIAAAALPLVAMGGSESSVETVTVWHSNSGKAGAAFDQIVEDFNATIGKEKGIEIEPVYQGLDNDVLTKVKAAASADLSSLPDIAQMDATSCLDMMNADYLITIDELGFDTSILLPQAVEAFSSYKGLLGLPFSCSLLLAYYDKTLFDSLGLEPPRTLDELTGIAPLIGAKDSSGKVTRYAMAGVPTTYELGAFIGAQEGLSYFVDNENGHAGTPTEVLFGKEGTFRNFLEHWKKLADTGYLNSIGSGTTTEFAAGRTAMILASSSSLTRILADVSGRFEVGTAFVPMTDEDATGGVNIGGDALFCFSGSDAVKTVLGYLTSPDVQMMWAKEKYRYAEYQGCQLVELPYSGGRYSMLVALPASGMSMDDAVSYLSGAAYKGYAAYNARRNGVALIGKARVCGAGSDPCALNESRNAVQCAGKHENGNDRCKNVYA